MKKDFYLSTSPPTKLSVRYWDRFTSFRKGKIQSLLNCTGREREKERGKGGRRHRGRQKVRKGGEEKEKDKQEFQLEHPSSPTELPLPIS